MKKCFIVMPITTPDFALADYRGDKDHFKHILDHLFIPAVKKAELEPIPPTTKGSEIIHGEVVKSIETSDLVLCDISCLNPNVFFELGIRTAINKPVCLVKDNITKDVPFDTNAINHHEYRCHLNIWENEEEIEKLFQHLKDTIEKSDSKNSLWKYFSITARAESLNQGTVDSDKHDYLVMQLDAIRKQLAGIRPANKTGQERTRDDRNPLDKIVQFVSEYGIPANSVSFTGPYSIHVGFEEEPTEGVIAILERFVRRMGFSFDWDTQGKRKN